MKKALSLALCALLLLALLPALAETQPPFEPIVPLPRVEVELNQPEDITRSLPQTTDVVQITDGVYTITSKGVTISLQAPFGFYGFSQDVAQQMDAYMHVFQNPRAAMEYIFALDLSLFLTAPQSTTQLMYFTRRTQVSEFFVSLLDTASFETALNYFASNVKGDIEVGRVTIKGREFITSREVTNGNQPTLVYFTYQDGAMLGFQLIPDGEQISPEEVELLASFVEMVTFP